MRLVNDDCVVGVEKLISLCFREQNAVGHQFDEPVLRRFFGEAHLVADARADILAQLFRDALRHATRGDPARLRVTDQTKFTATCRECDLWQLCCFPRTRFAREHDHLMITDKRRDLIGTLRNRQTFGIDNRRRTIQARGETLLSASNIRRDLIGFELR